MSTASAGRSSLAWAPLVVLVAAVAGASVSLLAVPVVHDRYFPWIVGRALGLAAYTALFALSSLGLFLRHPWRLRWPILHPETALRLHAALASATIVLVAGHLVSLASDAYAGVGWRGALLPGASAYRTAPVAIGVAAFWAMLAVAASARLGGRLLRARWLPIHQLSMPIFAAVFVHGVLSGTDTLTLRAGYGATGLFVVLLWGSRRMARPPLASSLRRPVGAARSGRSGTRASA